MATMQSREALCILGADHMWLEDFVQPSPRGLVLHLNTSQMLMGCTTARDDVNGSHCGSLIRVLETLEIVSVHL